MNPSSSIITLLLALLLPSCAAQFLEDPPCSVCGDGIEVGNPDAVASLFHAPSGAQILCGTLEKMGLDGRIAPSQCAVMPSLIGVDCGCKSINSPIAIGLTNTAIEATATEAITAEATATATEATWSGSSYSYSMSISSLKSKSTKVAKSKSTKLNHPILYPSCSVCGAGMQVGNPFGIVDLPLAAPIFCTILEAFGNVGFYPPTDCTALPPLINDVCQCGKPNDPSFSMSYSMSVSSKEATRVLKSKSTKRV